MLLARGFVQDLCSFSVELAKRGWIAFAKLISWVIQLHGTTSVWRKVHSVEYIPSALIFHDTNENTIQVESQEIIVSVWPFTPTVRLRYGIRYEQMQMVDFHLSTRQCTLPRIPPHASSTGLVLDRSGIRNFPIIMFFSHVLNMYIANFLFHGHTHGNM